MSTVMVDLVEAVTKATRLGWRWDHLHGELAALDLRKRALFIASRNQAEDAVRAVD